MAQAWQVIDSKQLLSRRWLTVHEQRVRLPNGYEIEQFHLLEAPSWTAVLALTPDHQVVLVRQYRHGLGKLSLELPAGVIDEGESAQEAARRELLEETGYVAEAMQPLLVAAPEPARSTQLAHIFFAKGAVRRTTQQQEACENIEVLLEDARSLTALACEGKIIHGTHLAAILKAERMGLLG